MSLTQALTTAVSGLRATQAGLSIVSRPTWPMRRRRATSARRSSQVTSSAGDAGDRRAGRRHQSPARPVRAAPVARGILRRELTPTSGPSSMTGCSRSTARRAPATALDTVYNNFTTALQTLSTSPDDSAARSAVVSSAQVLTQQLNSHDRCRPGPAQRCRTRPFRCRCTTPMTRCRRIANINQQLGGMSNSDAATASLLDQRDQLVNQLSQLMDIKVVQNDHNQISVFTNSGIQLVGSLGVALDFRCPGLDDADGAVERRSDQTHCRYDHAGRAERRQHVDLIANKSIRSGQIAAYLEMRDQILLQAQRQLDQLAAGMARALSDQTINGSVRDLRTTVRFRRRSERIAGWQFGPVDLHRQHDEYAAHRHDRSRRRSFGAAAAPIPRPPIPTTRSSGSISPAARLRSRASSIRRLRTASLQFSNPSGTTLACAR